MRCQICQCIRGSEHLVQLSPYPYLKTVIFETATNLGDYTKLGVMGLVGL